MRIKRYALHFLMTALLVGCKGSTTLTVVTYGGGAYQQSHIEAFLGPFADAKGVKTESVVWGAEYARLSEMVRSGNVPWDVVEVTAAQFERGKRDDLFETITEPIDPSIFRPLENGPTPHHKGVPNVYWSTVLAYRVDAFSSPPIGWASFWDTSSFPGARAMYDDPRGNIEFALLAAGVNATDLYPLDVDLAFEKLDEIKPYIRVWWSDGTEPVRLLINDQVKMSSAWSGRLFASEQAKDKVRLTWNGAAHELDYWVIPRGAKNLGLASAFIQFASSPRPMARQAELTAYGPANSKALSEVAPAVIPHLPTAPDNWRVSFVVDAEWWAANEANVLARWIQWRNE